jgi:hypothetical protein
MRRKASLKAEVLTRAWKCYKARLALHVRKFRKFDVMHDKKFSTDPSVVAVCKWLHRKTRYLTFNRITPHGIQVLVSWLIDTKEDHIYGQSVKFSAFGLRSIISSVLNDASENRPCSNVSLALVSSLDDFHSAMNMWYKVKDDFNGHAITSVINIASDVLDIKHRYIVNFYAGNAQVSLFLRQDLRIALLHLNRRFKLIFGKSAKEHVLRTLEKGKRECEEEFKATPIHYPQKTALDLSADRELWERETSHLEYVRMNWLKENCEPPEDSDVSNVNGTDGQQTLP